jgi:hypothetical protein
MHREPGAQDFVCIGVGWYCCYRYVGSLFHMINEVYNKRIMINIGISMFLQGLDYQNKVI